MNDNNQLYKSYNKAKKQVENEKEFYHHIVIYIVINILIIVVNRIIYINMDKSSIDHNFTEWLNWNLIIPPVSWGIGLLCNGLWVFKKNSFVIKKYRKSFFSKEWEERKINELMNKE